MDANLNFLTASTTNPTSVGAPSGSTGLDPSLAKPMNGQEFAGVMRDLMAKGERQDVAGIAPGEATDANAAALQTLNLGNQFSVITAASPLPDPNSLAQFARAQGLSESAVQALFGDLALPTASASASATALPISLTPEISQVGGLVGFPANPLSTNPVIANPLMAHSVAATSDASTLTLLPSAATLGWIQANPSSLTISDQVDKSVWTQAPQLSLTSANPKVSDVSALMATAGATGVLQALGGMGAVQSQSLWTQAPHLSLTSANPKVSDVSALMATAGATGVLQALGGMGAVQSQSLWTQAPHLSLTSANPKVSDVSALMATAGATGVLQALGGMGAMQSQSLTATENLAEIAPELGPLDAMRMRMMPAWENMTRQLAKLNGTDQAAAWGQLCSNILSSKEQCTDGKEVLLDLGITDPSLMSALDALQDQSNTSPVNLDSARNTASSGALGAAATSAALANPAMTDRAAQIQDLADKLGKAMGERLQEQLERGEWKLQLKLNPAHLGRIDVELDMSATGLDAVFKTDNMLTRELIAQGMNKLRDSLAQSGMTVANVWVNSENQKGSGGNSTPRQDSEPDNTVNNSVSEVKVAESRIKELRSSDAWDTLA